MAPKTPGNTPPGGKSKGGSSSGSQWDILGWSPGSKIPTGSTWGPRPWNEKKKGEPVQTRFIQYRAGMENSPPAGANTPDGIAQIQMKLVAAGYLSGYRAKIWDGPTRAAFKSLMADANINGTTWDKMLDQAITGAAETGAGGGGAGKQGDYQLPTFNVENADDLHDLFKQTGRAAIGYAPSDEEVNSMVMAYQQMQIGRQQRALDRAITEHDAQVAGQMGIGAPDVVESDADPQEFARRRFEAAHPFEAAAGKGAEQIQAALGFLGQGGNQ